MSLKLKSYTEIISIIDNGSLEKKALHFLLISFGFLGILYILILGNIVFNIVERKNMEEYARVLGGEVGNLELSFLSLSSNVDLALSHSLGFKETNVKFATRKILSSIKVAQNEI